MPQLLIHRFAVDYRWRDPEATREAEERSRAEKPETDYERYFCEQTDGALQRPNESPSELLVEQFEKLAAKRLAAAAAAAYQPVLAPHFEDVARLIAAPPPAWLVPAIADVVAKLRFARSLESKQPRRAEMRNRLTLATRSAEPLLAAIDDMAILGFLDHAEGRKPMSARALNQLAAGLKEWRDRAETGTKAIRDGGGRDLAWATPSASPQVLCATFVSEAWCAIHQAPPPAGNRRAQDAAAALWRASGEETTGWGSSNSGWRKHFQAISKFDDDRISTARLIERYRCAD
jgi:hypothetical protein